eukprot:11196649-Lingulodinium_polyedra.AAC.1
MLLLLLDALPGLRSPSQGPVHNRGLFRGSLHELFSCHATAVQEHAETPRAQDGHVGRGATGFDDACGCLLGHVRRLAAEAA